MEASDIMAARNFGVLARLERRSMGRVPGRQCPVNGAKTTPKPKRTAALLILCHFLIFSGFPSGQRVKPIRAKKLNWKYENKICFLTGFANHRVLFERANRSIDGG
jgi:hypothetical protein